MEKNLVFPYRGAGLKPASRSIFAVKALWILWPNFLELLRLVSKKSTRKAFNYYFEFLIGKLWISQYRVKNSRIFNLRSILEYGFLGCLYALILLYDQACFCFQKGRRKL